MKKFIITIILVKIAILSFCQTNINWRQINKDLAKVDSLEAVSEFYLNDNHRLSRTIIFKDSIIELKQDIVDVKINQVKNYQNEIINKEIIIADLNHKNVNKSKWIWGLSATIVIQLAILKFTI